MSWRKKKKEMTNIKHKARLIICLMFAVVIGLIIFLTIKIVKNNEYYKIDSRIEKVNNSKPYENSSYKTIGWLKVQGTNIDVPILHSNNSEENFPVELEDFVWSNNYDTKFHNKINIEGHNIFNLSKKPKIKSELFHRFEELMGFIYYDFAKENKYIQLTIDGKDYIYKIFSVSFINKADTTSFPLHDEYTQEEIKSQIELFKDTSLYDYDVDVREDDKLISLATCTRFYGVDENVKFYVNGRLLRDGEKINNYGVTKSKLYKEIENVLKGDETNEDEDM